MLSLPLVLCLSVSIRLMLKIPHQFEQLAPRKAIQESTTYSILSKTGKSTPRQKMPLDRLALQAHFLCGYCSCKVFEFSLTFNIWFCLILTARLENPSFSLEIAKGVIINWRPFHSALWDVPAGNHGSCNMMNTTTMTHALQVHFIRRHACRESW